MLKLLLESPITIYKEDIMKTLVILSLVLGFGTGVSLSYVKHYHSKVQQLKENIEKINKSRQIQSDLIKKLWNEQGE